MLMSKKSNYAKLPTDFLNEEAIWINRILELEYLAGMQGVQL